MVLKNDFDSVFESRRSIRKYDSAVKISWDKMEQILNEAMLAPSSFNMQPCRFVVVETTEMREKIKPYIQFNQSQNDTASFMLFLLGDYNCFDNSETIFQTSVDKGYMPKEVMEQQMKMLTPYYNQVSQQSLKERILLDAGIISMNLMLAAKNHGYDTCPMGGFDKENILKVLGLDEERYFPILMLSIGKADETGYKSYRLPAKELSFWR
ncbi:nitroreductase family protein [Listeria monocytogenes]|uniref:Nitroreductase family protein n=1 Tax=Listeria monocytogenes TaxID=1639 RepID=A0AAN3BET4_LISMN|nr:nitroreductase family protein [Listeria monocytogenes]EAC3367796.1 nitroreductase family protein [Listeria monocytogenes]EAC7086898.1 nitroreductase family protein [Listeria monocytogenes]EAC8542051.1 nitroreductase family protein [Listeria monocytogenes]EAC8548053.1 nitroreductase family protein [Listeria monocytogenes]